MEGGRACHHHHSRAKPLVDVGNVLPGSSDTEFVELCRSHRSYRVVGALMRIKRPDLQPSVRMELLSTPGQQTRSSNGEAGLDRSLGPKCLDDCVHGCIIVFRSHCFDKTPIHSSKPANPDSIDISHHELLASPYRACERSNPGTLRIRLTQGRKLESR